MVGRIEIKFKYLVFWAFSLIAFGCNSYSEFKTEDYTLLKNSNEKAVVILFPCYFCDAEHTLSEAKFIDELLKNKISVVLLNENKKLFLKESDKYRLSNFLSQIINQNKISADNLVLGGFSSGGNLAGNLSVYMQKNAEIKPKAVFMVDSPIDLEQLYVNSKKDIDLNFNQNALDEAIHVSTFLENEIGKPDEKPNNYLNHSFFMNSQKEKLDLEFYKNLKIRFYSEPDSIWYSENRGRNLDETNYFQLKMAHEFFSEKGLNSDLILTQNKGYRKDEERHPHSWSIVDGRDLVSWILDK